MSQVTWQAVQAAVAAHRFEGSPLSGVTEDSRAVVPGAVFVARPGRTWDGHRFAGAAAAAGAALLVVERPCPSPLPQCVIPSAGSALSRLAALWHGEPARALRLVGVTGTNGKTTVARLTAAVLEAGGVPASSLGTLGVWVRGERVQAHLPWTTPPAPVLHGHLAAMRASGVAACVLEVSAQALDQRRVDDCPFEVAAVTSIAREHGEYFVNQEAYHAAKLRLFGADRPAGPPAWSVVNEDLRGFVEPALRGRDGQSPRYLTYGWSAGSVRVDAWTSHGLEGSDLALSVLAGRRRRRLTLRLGLSGAHNVENALCAFAIGHALGLAPAAILRGLEAVTSVPGRLQHVCRTPYQVIVDYAHNPAGLRATLATVRGVTRGRLCLVLGARGGRDTGKRPLMGAVAAALCDRVVVTSDQPASEDPEEAALTMRRAAADCGAPVEFYRSRLEALRAAVADLRPGDTLLVVGKGDEPWQGDGEPGPGTTDAGVLEGLLPLASPVMTRTKPMATPVARGVL